MKLLKKMLSVFLTAAIMVSMVCVGTVSVGAAESDLPYVEMSENSYYKTLTYTLWLQGEQKKMWGDDSYYSVKCSHDKYYGIRYDLVLEDGTNEYVFSMIRYPLTYSWWFYENDNPIDDVAVVYSAETGWQDGVRFEISTDSAYYEKLLKCTKASVINCMALDNNCCTTICADGTKKDSELGYTEVELHNLNVKLDETASTSKTKISSLEISDLKNYTYTGKNRKAAVTIKDGDYTLVKGTDYTLTYKNCKNIGTATVTIKGKGKYTGTKTLTYKIVPKKTTLTAKKSSDTKIKLSWTEIKGAEKYQIYYSTNGGKYKKLTTVSADKLTRTISGLDFKKNDYKFKIRSYKTVDGKKYYSSFSKAITIK